MSVLKHLKTLQHVSKFSNHLQGARRFLVEVNEFKSSVTSTRKLRAPWRWSEKIETCWSVL